jgi:hypothetical protein
MSGICKPGVFDKVVIRQLKFKRTNEQIDKLESVLSEIVGREYEFSISYVMANNRQSIKLPDQTTLVDQQRKFFCSELVAKVYKVCGIMDDEKSSTGYLPCHFA